MRDNAAQAIGAGSTVRSRRFGVDAHSERDATRAAIAVRIAVCSVVFLAFVLRLGAAIRLSPHVDEAASILAAGVVAERFLPILPSGTVYFQGFTLSLFLAPLSWLGYGNLGDLLLMRLVPVIAGTAAVYLAYRFGYAVTRSQWVGVGAGMFVAVDPLSVQWSGHVRMYSLLQLISIALIWAVVMLIAHGVTWNRALAVVSLSWLAVFTHVGAAVLVASIGIGALVLRGWRLWRHPRLMCVLVASGLAVVALMVLNRVLAPSVTTQVDDEAAGSVTFVGNSQIVPFGRFREGSVSEQWAALASAGVQFWLGPVLIVAVGTLVAAGLYLYRWRSVTSPVMKTAIVVVFMVFWVTAVAFVVFTDAFAGRYLLHAYTPAYLFLAMLAVDFARRGSCARTIRGLAAPVASVIAAVAVLVLVVTTRLQWRFDHWTVNPDYHAAMSYVRDNHTPGQPVIVALPSVGYLGLEDDAREDVYFLAGPRDGDRARDYSRLTNDGRRIDYWVGVETLVSAEELRRVLLESPGAFLVLDSYRLNVDWAYGGDIEWMIRSMSSVVYEGPGGVVVFAADTPHSVPPAFRPD